MTDALLACLHIYHNVPTGKREGSFLICQVCGQDEELVRIMHPPQEWVVECQECSYTHWCGQAVSLGRILSAKHRAKTGHTMRLRRADMVTGR
jgi:hypothetical protein